MRRRRPVFNVQEVLGHLETMESGLENADESSEDDFVSSEADSLDRDFELRETMYR